MKAKAKTSIYTLCKGLPQEFLEYIKYVLRLEFNQKPNYCGLIKIFQKAIDKDIEENGEMKLDWIISKNSSGTPADSENINSVDTFY